MYIVTKSIKSTIDVSFAQRVKPTVIPIKIVDRTICFGKFFMDSHSNQIVVKAKKVIVVSENSLFPQRTNRGLIVANKATVCAVSTWKRDFAMGRDPKNSSASVIVASEPNF